VKLHKAIEDVQEAEAELAKQLRSVGERHATEPDLYQLGHVLARQCADHIRRLAPFAESYGASRRADNIAETPGVLETLRRKGSELVGHSEVSGLLLLRDLRHLYLVVQDRDHLGDPRAGRTSRA